MNNTEMEELHEMEGFFIDLRDEIMAEDAWRGHCSPQEYLLGYAIRAERSGWNNICYELMDIVEYKALADKIWHMTNLTSHEKSLMDDALGKASIQKAKNTLDTIRWYIKEKTGKDIMAIRN